MSATAAERSYEHFDHGADIGVRGRGATLEAAFEGAALALTAVVCDPGEVRPREAVRVRCQNPDPELLLVDWLNAVVFEMATRRMLFSRFEVDPIADGRLEAVLHGEAADPRRHQPVVEVKGATLTELTVVREPDGTWLAQCVVDV